MKKYIITFLLLITGCVNTGQIISGKLIGNDISQDITGKTIILNDDCSPKRVDIDIPYCGNNDIVKNELCTITPDKGQYGYKIFQMINEKDALICTINGYGNCYGNIEYVKNLGAGLEGLVDDDRITGAFLLKKDPYVYNITFGKKTVNGYEFVTKAKFDKIKYVANDVKKCPKKEYSYSKDSSKGYWIED